jgi:tRNA (cmo5U34)-methyltransferase
MTSSVRHIPSGSWVFDAEVARVFDDMLDRSIPGHAEMRRVMGEVLGYALRDRKAPHVLDVGCSLGMTARTLVGYVEGVRVYGIDSSPAMVAEAQGLLPLGSTAQVRDVEEEGLPEFKFDAAVWCLTLQFLPVESRPRLLDATRQALRPGGVALVVEKVQGEDGWGHSALVDIYHRRKMSNGYSEGAVAEKAKSLRYVMATLSEAQNVALFRGAGFRVQPVWRTLNFAAWLLRPEHEAAR